MKRSMTMKKLVTLCLAIALLLTCSSALAAKKFSFSHVVARCKNYLWEKTNSALPRVEVLRFEMRSSGSLYDLLLQSYTSTYTNIYKHIPTYTYCSKWSIIFHCRCYSYALRWMHVVCPFKNLRKFILSMNTRAYTHTHTQAYTEACTCTSI